MNKLKVIDLFAGCGGLSLGFKQSNYDICASIEIENAFCKTLQANADKKELILNFDITEEDKYIDKLRHHIEKKIDGVIGGPPCQAYSIAGRINKNNKIKGPPPLLNAYHSFCGNLFLCGRVTLWLYFPFSRLLPLL